MKHKWLRNYDSNGVWTKAKRIINVDGVEYNLDDYAATHGIKLPDAKPKKQKQVNTDADMEQSLDSRDIEVDGDGDSESTE